MSKPSLRRELAKMAVENTGVSVALACRAFDISESCYRYEPLLSDENALIADWLVSLTDAHPNCCSFCVLSKVKMRCNPDCQQDVE